MAKITRIGSEVYPRWDGIYGFDSDGDFYQRTDPSLPPITGMSFLSQVRRTNFFISRSAVEPRDLFAKISVREYSPFQDDSGIHCAKARRAQFSYLFGEAIGDRVVLVPLPNVVADPDQHLTTRMVELICAVDQQDANEIGLAHLRQLAEQRQSPENSPTSS